MELLKTYKSSIVMFVFVLIGGIVGAVMGPKASILEPFGNLFLNLIFTIIVPLVFFSVTSAIANMTNMKRLGKILINIFIVFTCTAFIAAVIGLVGALIINPTKGIDSGIIQKMIAQASGELSTSEHVGPLQQLVNTFTVSDFVLLFSKKNMLQLIVFSIIFGTSIVAVGKKAEPFVKFLDSGAEIFIKMVNIIMHFAPIGLGCYFASVIGQLGAQILEGYLRVFILYLTITGIYYFGMFTLYAFIAGGNAGVKLFWRNALEPSATALATCSSAACIPVNLKSTKKMGVTDDIAETIIPLGANTHKDGSVIGGVLKIVFLLGLFGRDVTSFKAVVGIIFVSYLVGAVMGAIPGGGMIGEVLIISVYGFPPESLAIIAVISTIIDAPATLLNSTGNAVCAMLVTRLVEGKKWISDMLESNDSLDTQIIESRR